MLAHVCPAYALSRGQPARARVRAPTACTRLVPHAADACNHCIRRSSDRAIHPQVERTASEAGSYALSSNTQHISVEEDGRVLAEADIHSDAQHRSVHADLHVEAGHLPIGTRSRLVDAVLDQSAAGSHLDATLPAGDGEILDRLRERCDDVQARSAGASTLATATVLEK